MKPAVLGETKGLKKLSKVVHSRTFFAGVGAGFVGTFKFGRTISRISQDL